MAMKVSENNLELGSYDRELAEKGLRRVYAMEMVSNPSGDTFGVCYREVIVPIEKTRKPRKRGSAGS